MTNDYLRVDPSVRKVAIVGDDDGTLRVINVDSSGTLETVQGVKTDIEGGGKVSVSTTAIEATFTGTISSILISADVNNSGTLYVGKSNVASDGSNAITFLSAGDTVSFDYDDATNAIYVVASTTGQYFWKGATL